MRRLAPLLVAAMLGALTGCAGDWGTAAGTVTHNGAPLKKGTVTFTPKEGPTAYATIADGNFTVMTGSSVGLKPGDYVVTVVDQTIPDPDANELAKILTPVKYASPATSDLKA